MGRTVGSDNLENKWEFIIKNPCSQNSVLFSKYYVSIKTMYEDLKDYFSKAQLSSYASKSRNCSKIIEIKKICKNSHVQSVHDLSRSDLDTMSVLHTFP